MAQELRRPSSVDSSIRRPIFSNAVLIK